ncbi:MAG: hypothetical protein PVH54_04765 [Gammaproteobacteria bacterium]|jgi:hypothetical protein
MSPADAVFIYFLADHVITGMHMDFLALDDLSISLRDFVARVEGNMDYIAAGTGISIAILMILKWDSIIRFFRSITINGKETQIKNNESLNSNNEILINDALLELHKHGADLSQKMDELNFVFLDMSANPIITPEIEEVENRYMTWEEKTDSFLVSRYPADSIMFKKLRTQIHARKRRLQAQLQLITGILSRIEIAGNTD